MVYTPEPIIMAEDRDDYVSEEELIARMQTVGDPAVSDIEDPNFEVDMDSVIIAEYRAKEEDGLGNVVKFVSWRYEWTDPAYPGTVVASGFVTELPDPDSENFIEFESITQDTLKQWVTEMEISTLRENRVYALSQISIQHKINETTVYTFV